MNNVCRRHLWILELERSMWTPLKYGVECGVDVPSRGLRKRPIRGTSERLGRVFDSVLDKAGLDR